MVDSKEKYDFDPGVKWLIYSTLEKQVSKYLNPIEN